MTRGMSGPTLSGVALSWHEWPTALGGCILTVAWHCVGRMSGR